MKREHGRKKKEDLLAYIRNGKELTTGQKLLLVTKLSAPAIMAQLWIAMCIELCFRGCIFLIRIAGKKWLEKSAVPQHTD